MVQERRLELGAVRHDAEGGGRQVDDDPDGSSERASQQVFDVGQHGVDRDRGDLDPLRPREGEQLLRQLGAAVARQEGIVDPLAEFGMPRMAADHLDIARDRLEEIVEVVSDAARQLAQRLHLLGLDERRIASPVDRDVATDRIDRPAFGRDGPGDPDVVAVGPREPCFEAVERLAIADRRQRGRGPRAVIGVDEIEKARPPKTAALVSQEARPGGIDGEDAARFVDHREQVVRQIRDPLSFPLRFRGGVAQTVREDHEPLLLPMLLRDVDVHTDVAGRPAVFAQHRGTARADPARRGAVAQPQPKIDRERL